MSLTKGSLESLEQVIADAISADSVIAANPNTVIHVDPQKNIVDEITIKVGKFHNVIVPLVESATDDESGIEGVFYDDVPFSVTVFQNSKIVGSGLSARALAERIAAILKGNSGWPRNVSLRKPTIEHIPDKVLNIYQVNAQTAADGGILTQLPAITGSVAGGHVTLACAQPGAAIFYTLDGTPPNTSSSVYTTPVAASGVVVNARAWLAGFLASNPFQINA